MLTLSPKCQQNKGEYTHPRERKGSIRHITSFFIAVPWFDSFLFIALALVFDFLLYSTKKKEPINFLILFSFWFYFLLSLHAGCLFINQVFWVFVFFFWVELIVVVFASVWFSRKRGKKVRKRGNRHVQDRFLVFFCVLGFRNNGYQCGRSFTFFSWLPNRRLWWVLWVVNECGCNIFWIKMKLDYWIEHDCFRHFWVDEFRGKFLNECQLGTGWKYDELQL